MFVKSQLADWDLTSLTCANQISRWVGSNYYQLLFHVNSPQFDISACGSTESPEYVTQFSCLGNNLLFPEYSEQQHREREARLSFLSGHSSLAWYGMIFAAGFIQRLRNKSSSSQFHPFLVVLQVRNYWTSSKVKLFWCLCTLSPKHKTCLEHDESELTHHQNWEFWQFYHMCPMITVSK